MTSARKLESRHGIVCRMPGDKFGYFGWPTVARHEDGTLIVASSGLRTEHVCPWGKTVLNFSGDDGRTWSAPRVINNSPLDDRDAGVVCLGGDRLLVSWFTSDTRNYRRSEWCREFAERDNWDAALGNWTDELVRKWLGSWIMLSSDRGKTWGPPLRTPVSAPHGPIRLACGDLLYLGRPMGPDVRNEERTAEAWRSADGGKTWNQLGRVPAASGARGVNNDEPHVIELPGGKLAGMLRFELHGENDPAGKAGHVAFSTFQTDSDDGGKTWSVPRSLGIYGSPPHLMRHSSGALVMTYGYRTAPFGQRVAFSRDDGATWEHDWIIRDDGPDGDLGYPSTVEMSDGSLFTVCYQKAAGDTKCSLLWSRWKMP